MTVDPLQISPVGAHAASVGFRVVAGAASNFATMIRAYDSSGADLAPLAGSATRMLDEIDQEVGMLAELFRTRAELATLADRYAGGDPTAEAELLAQFASTAGLLAQSVDDSIGTDRVEFEPTADWSPDDVAAWWASLSIEEQEQLQALSPAAVGNTDGIPYATRIETNGVRIEAWFDEHPNDDRLDQFTIPGTDVIDPNRKFVLFDPFGDGMAAELFGNLDTATSVAVLVPGMGSELGNFNKVSGNARALYENDPSIAVIAWSGYDAPKGLFTGHNVQAAFEVSGDRLARTGGESLAMFRNGLALESGAPLTVVGHSYGSLVTGHAVQQGLTADQVVFIGSPGVGVDSVGEFPDGAVGEYFAARVHGDPVAELKHFGDAPTDPDFGAHVYDAGEPNGLLLGLHSEYFDSGTAIDNLTTIVNGGDPTEDRPTFTNYITEPYSDLDIPFFPGDDLPTGWVDTTGAHVEDWVGDGYNAVENEVKETVDELGDLADDAKSEWDRWSNPSNWIPGF